MKGKTPIQEQGHLFGLQLSEMLNPKHELYILADCISWKSIENEFSSLYSNTGQPAKTIRLMSGLLLLKQMFNLSDEVVVGQWIQNPYYQYFCGESSFRWKMPCDPSDLVHFRKRIGEQGAEKIFSLSVKMHGLDVEKAKDALIDTTAQEKNITFPTDSKHHRKIIDKCNQIAKQEGIELRQTYTRTVKNLLIKLRFSRHPKKQKQAKSAMRHLKIIAGRQIRDLKRNLSEEAFLRYQQRIEIYEKVLLQTRTSKNKIYSLHEPEVSCIAKGKSHKEYEFGSKVAFALIPRKNIIVGVVNFKGNPNDSTTLQETLQAAQRQSNKVFENAIADRGYRGNKLIGDTKIIIPGQQKPKSEYQKQKIKKKCRSRAAIEPVIGHLKSDCRMVRNYLKGSFGDSFNAIMAATAWNLRKYIQKIKAGFIFHLKFLQNIFSFKQIILFFLNSFSLKFSS